MATGLQYNQLSTAGKEIRLLYFPKDGCDSQERLRCDIRTVSLSSEPLPQYIAVSYTWGDASDRRELKIGEQLVDVPRNAEIALRYLHRHGGQDEDGEPVGFWLDAVCINQVDATEKGHQIGLMGNIYSHAREVYIWLGEAEASKAESAVSTIKSLRTECDRTMGSSGLRNPLRELRLSDDALQNVDLNALEAIFASPWHSRLWVMQETLLAQRAICFLGQASVPWPDVALAAHFLLSRRLWLHEVKWFEGAVLATSLWKAMRNMEAQRSTITNLMSLSLQRRATLPHDKVYGILGLLSATIPEDPGRRLLRLADLRLSWEDLYVMVTAVGATCGDFAVLAFADPTAPEPDDVHWRPNMPSWVPRYDLSLKFAPSGLFQSYGPQVGAGPADALSWDANDPYTLMAKGFVLDEVEVEGPIFKLADDDVASFNRIGGRILACRRCIANSAASKFPELQKDLDLAKTLVVGCPTSPLALASDSASATKAVRELWELCERYSRIDGLREWQSKEDFTVGSAWAELITMYSQGRRFAVSKQGRLAMVSPRVRKGDRFCVFTGVKLPFVLRPIGGKWRLVGDAYVHGEMRVSGLPISLRGR